MKTLTTISPSQIETFLSCERKWWLNKILGLPIPQHPSAALGEKVHKGQEDYLETGDEAAVHALAKGTLPILRELRERKLAGSVFMERSLKRQLRNGLGMAGRIDILDMTERPTLVLDWKTTGNVAYAKTEEELKSNVQMLTYAYEATVLDIERNGVPKERHGVDVAHVYISTKGTTAPFVRRAHIPLDDIHAGWRRIQDISDRMLATSKTADPVEVKPNLNACNAFGGCPFRDRCKALQQTQPAAPAPASSTTQESTMPMPAAPYADALRICGNNPEMVKSMFGNTMTPAEFDAWKNGSATAAAEPVQQVNRGVLPPEAGDPRAPAPAPVQAAPEEDDGPSEEDINKQVKHLENLGWSEEAIQSLTDDEFTKVVSKNWRFEDVEFDKVKNGESPSGFDYTNVRKRKPVEPAPVAAAPTAAEPARRRGRPPGSKNKPKEPEAQEPAPVAEQQPVAALSPAAIPPVDTAPVPVTPAKVEGMSEQEKAAYQKTIQEHASTIQKQATRVADLEKQVAAAQASLVEARSAPTYTVPPFTLYIDCLPEKGVAFTHLDDAIAPFCKLAAENYQDEKTGKVTPVTHYSLIPFGKGPGMVAAYVLKNIAEVARGVVVCDTRSPAATAVLEVLRPVADVVVRGMGR